MKLNPFALTTHNHFALLGCSAFPRYVFHLFPHALLGFVASVIALIIGAPLWASVAATLLVAVTLKLSWFDWPRTTGRVVHFPVFHRMTDVPDVVSDLALGVLGALVLPLHLAWWIVALAYYALSTFNGT